MNFVCRFLIHAFFGDSRFDIFFSDDHTQARKVSKERIIAMP